MTENSLSASLLVAMPQLNDPNFRRSVLLLIEHAESGSFGLVLNRPADLSLSDLFDSLQFQWRGGDEERALWGGPVELNSGWMLFGDSLAVSAEDEEVTPVLTGVNFAGSLEVFREVAQTPPAQLRFFLGYAGWGPGQLEFELSQGAWLSAAATSDVIFGVAPERMWDHVVRALGIDPATLVSTSGVH